MNTQSDFRGERINVRRGRIECVSPMGGNGQGRENMAYTATQSRPSRFTSVLLPYRHAQIYNAPSDLRGKRREVS